MTDGDGWTQCALGHRHWGRYGAAGLLLVAPGPLVLLQHRAGWSHHGDTWGIPGGAQASHESAEQAALREAGEETGLDSLAVEVVGEHIDDHGGWVYTTVLARVPHPVAVHALDAESNDVRWVGAQVVVELELHPGFAATWPTLASRLPAHG